VRRRRARASPPPNPTCRDAPRGAVRRSRLVPRVTRAAPSRGREARCASLARAASNGAARCLARVSSRLVSSRRVDGDGDRATGVRGRGREDACFSRLGVVVLVRADASSRWWWWWRGRCKPRAVGWMMRDRDRARVRARGCAREDAECARGGGW